MTTCHELGMKIHSQVQAHSGLNELQHHFSNHILSLQASKAIAPTREPRNEAVQVSRNLSILQQRFISLLGALSPTPKIEQKVYLRVFRRGH